MKKLLLILTICVGLSGYVAAQCTISQAIITNASLVGGVAHFSLQFKHVRNAGNKWVTIHMWNSPSYPNYGYGSVPTLANIGAIPFGTIVIDNSAVSGSGTYGASAFASSYQNDGTFVLLNTSSSSIVYNASTDIYTLNGLEVILPPGTSVIKFDTWSSQANTNQVVHCFSSGGTIIVPSVLPARGLEKSFKVEPDGNYIKFSWSTESESNNSHFEVQKQVGGSWVSKGILSSKYEDGNSSTLTNYVLRIKRDNHMIPASLPYLFIVLVLGLLIRKYVPMRITCILVFVFAVGMISCDRANSNSVSEDELSSEWYRLRQVDKNQNSTTTTARMTKV